jgi:hypothetical protein
MMKHGSRTQADQTNATNTSHGSGDMSGSANAWRWLRSRRTAITFLAVFAVVAWAKPMGLLLWARIRILTSLPKTAIADDPTARAGSEKPETPSEFDPGLGTSNEIRMDPFWIDPHTFPKLTPSPKVEAPSEPPPKVEPPSADEAKRDESQAAAKEAEQFRLQSAGKGLSIAVIDGRAYRIGDVLEGVDGRRFTLVEVCESAAFVEWNGERFEIRLRTSSGSSNATGHGGMRD